MSDRERIVPDLTYQGNHFPGIFVFGCEVCPSLQQSHPIKPLRASSYLPAVGTKGGSHTLRKS